MFEWLAAINTNQIVAVFGGIFGIFGSCCYHHYEKRYESIVEKLDTIKSRLDSLEETLEQAFEDEEDANKII